MDFGCHNCGMHLQAEESLAGSVINCPGCGCELQIPIPNSSREFRFACPRCNVRMSADRSIAGTAVKCPGCSGELLVPFLDAGGDAVGPQRPGGEAAPDPARTRGDAGGRELLLTFECYACGSPMTAAFRAMGACQTCGAENQAFDAHDEILPNLRSSLIATGGLVAAFNSIRVKLAGQGLRDAALAGDLLLLLNAGRSRPSVNRQTTLYYGEMLAKLVRGARWRRLCHRLAALKRMSRGAGARSLPGSRAQRRDKRNSTPWESAVDFIERYILIDLIGKERAPDEYQGLPWCDYIAWGNCGRFQREGGQSSRDSSAWLVTDHLLTVAEIASRAEVPENVQNVANKPLVDLCAEAEVVHREFEPRQLEIIRREGDTRDRSPGDHSSVRAVSKKTREDQIPKILPSEFAMLKLRDRRQGRLLTLDKILNRSPLIYQHYQPESPEIRHRICLMVVVGAESRDWSVRSGDAKKPFNRARLLGYEILLNSSLWIPSDRIQADVVWLEFRSGDWRGAEFALESFSGVRTRRESYRNTLEANRLLPFFFAKQADAIKPQMRHEVKPLHECPGTVLQRLVSRHVYRAIYPAFLMETEDERGVCLPSSSLKLPASGRGAANALMAFFDNEDGEASLHADFFPDLTAAWVASLPLSRTNHHSVLVRYLEMVIGPMVKDPRPTAAS